MSIIHDALKKTQSNLQKKDGENISELYDKHFQDAKDKKDQRNQQVPRSPSEAPPKKKYTRTIIWAVLYLMFCGMLFWLNLESDLLNKFYLAVKNNVPQKIRSLKVQKPKPKPAPMRQYAKNDLVLTGTMMMDTKRVALINGEIYQVGDFVNGKEIINITLEKVELKDTEGIITLTVRKDS